MSRHSHDVRFSSPAVERARQKAEERMRALRDGATGRVHGDRVDLAVLTDELSDSPLEIKETLPQAWVHGLLDDSQQIHWSANGDANLDVELSRESAFVRMKGRAFFRLSHPCVRCGQRDVPFEWSLKIDLRLVERAPDTEINADFEAHDDGDDHAGSPLGNAADLEDIDIASYAGDSVDVGAVVREQLYLELPAHPNCTSPGSVLGEPCAFTEQQKRMDEEKAQWVDPRWGPLLALKGQLPVAAEPAKPAPAKPAKPAAATTTTTTTTTAPTTKPATTTSAPLTTTPPADQTLTPNPSPKGRGERAAPKKTAKKTSTKKTAKKTSTKKAAKKTSTKKAAKKASTKKAAKKTSTKKAAKKASTKKAAKKTSKKTSKKAAKKTSKKAAKKTSKKAAKKTSKKASTKTTATKQKTARR